MRYIFLIFCMFLCSACVPAPHSYTETPRVSGTVTKNGVPLSGATVLISDEFDDDVCSMAAKTTTTDADGRFKLSKTRGFGLFITMGDHLYSNQLCIKTADKTYIGYSRKEIGYPPKSIKLKCDINTKSITVDEKRSKAGIDQLAVCTVVKD